MTELVELPDSVGLAAEDTETLLLLEPEAPEETEATED